MKNNNSNFAIPIIQQSEYKTENCPKLPLDSQKSLGQLSSSNLLKNHQNSVIVGESPISGLNTAQNKSLQIRKKNFSDFPRDGQDENPQKEMTIGKRYQLAKAMQNPCQKDNIDLISDSDESNLSQSFQEMHGKKNKIEIKKQIEMQPQRAKIQRFQQVDSFKYCVYLGNFPQVVRQAFALRRDAKGVELWNDVEPNTDDIPNMDFVWKPVNFQRSHGFDMMAKRCQTFVDRPFGYCHYEYISVLSTKTGLLKTLREYYSKSPQFKRAKYTYDQTMSMSFYLPGADFIGCDDTIKVRKLFIKFEKKNLCGEKLSARQCQRNMWILKPENENRGRGIELVSSYKDLIAKMCGKIQGENFIIQKYIERPLLYYGRKFDIRVLGLIDDEKNFFLYKPCYLRTSSNNYTLSDQSKFIHLTNNCFQMKSENYQQHEAGNQIPYTSFLEYLDNNYKEDLSDLDKDHIFQRMKDIMIDCHLASISQLDFRKRPGSKFEVVGFDFILDEDLRVWLIEVNTCPYMGPVLTACHPHFMLDFIDDTFKLTIDKFFHEKNLSPQEIETETQYELLCTHDQTVNKRSKLGLDLSSPSTEAEGQVFPELPRSLYPSKIAYDRLVRSQTKHLRRWRKIKMEEFKQQQKMMRVRNKRFLQIDQTGPQPLKNSLGITNQVLAIKQGVESKSQFMQRPKNIDKLNVQRLSAKPQAQIKKAKENTAKADMDGFEPEKEIYQQKYIDYKPAQKSNEQSRAKSVIEEKVLNSSSSRALSKSKAKLPNKDASAQKPKRLPEKENEDADAITGHKIDHQSSQQKIQTVEDKKIPVQIRMKENILQSLKIFLNAYHRGAVGTVMTINQPDELRKSFKRLINQSIKLICKNDQKQSQQGFEVIKQLINQQFILFLQDDEILEILFKAFDSSTAKKDNNVEATIGVENAFLDLVKSQHGHILRETILNSQNLYGIFVQQMVESLEEIEHPESNFHLLLFILLCSIQSEGQNSKVNKRVVYIPGETQELRKLKRKSVQNGSIMVAHFIQQRFPALQFFMRSQYLRHLDWQDQIGHFMSIIHFFEKTPVIHLQRLLKCNNLSEKLKKDDQKARVSSPSQSPMAQKQNKHLSNINFGVGMGMEEGTERQCENFINLKNFIQNEIQTSQKYAIAKAESEKMSKKVSKLFVNFENSFAPQIVQMIMNPSQDEITFMTTPYIDSQFKIVRNIIERKLGGKSATTSLNEEYFEKNQHIKSIQEQELANTVNLGEGDQTQKRQTFKGNLMNHIMRGSAAPVIQIQDQASQQAQKPPKPQFIDHITNARNNGSILLDQTPGPFLDNHLVMMPLIEQKVSIQQKQNAMAQRLVDPNDFNIRKELKNLKQQDKITKIAKKNKGVSQ